MDVHWFVDQTAYTPYLRRSRAELSLTLRIMTTDLHIFYRHINHPSCSLVSLPLP